LNIWPADKEINNTEDGGLNPSGRFVETQLMSGDNDNMHNTTNFHNDAGIRDTTLDE